MAQNKPKNPKLHARLKREHHEAHKAHREEREQGERERFTRSPTPGQARHQAGAYANREYAPVIRGIREEGAQLAKQQEQSTAWYDQLGSEQAAQAQTQLGAANQFASSLTQQLAQANNTNAQYLASQQQAQAQQSALTGIPTQANSGNAAAAGANIANIDAVNLNAPTLGAAYNQAAQTNSLGIQSRERGHEVALGLQGERKKVRQDLRAAQKQKGQAYVGKLEEQRESARKQELDKAAFALEGQEAATQQAAEQQKIHQDEVQNKRQARTTRAGQASTAASSAASTAASVEGNQSSAQNARREQEEFDAERRYKRNHGGRTPAEVAALQKSREPSTSEKNDRKENVQNGYAAAQQAIKALGKSPTTYTPAEWLALEQHLTAPKTGREPGSGIDPAVARKVVEALKRKAEAAKPVVEVVKGATGF